MARRVLPLALAVFVVVVAVAAAAPRAQETIALPDEFRPEGIASGKGSSFYVGSIPQGAVYKGSYRTGQGDVLVPPHPGRNHTGLKVHKRSNRLFVAGGQSRAIYVYDATTGADVASFPLADAGFVNDVVLTRRAAYFTDSVVQQLYRLRIRRDGSLGPVTRIPLSGDIDFTIGFNANGIETLRARRKLVIVQTNTGKLFKVNARTGRTREIALDRPVNDGDGLLRRGRRLYVVQNQLNRVAVVKLSRRERRGRVRRFLTDPRLDVPTTIAPFKKFIYAVNARFGRPDDSDDDIIRLSRR